MKISEKELKDLVSEEVQKALENKGFFKGLAQKAAPTVGKLAGAALGAKVGGPLGAKVGAAAGEKVGQSVAGAQAQPEEKMQADVAAAIKQMDRLTPVLSKINTRSEKMQLVRIFLDSLGLNMADLNRVSKAYKTAGADKQAQGEPKV